MIQQLGQMESFAKKKKVSLTMGNLGRKFWHLEGIERQNDKKGSGKEVMNHIVKKADEHKKHIVLYPTHKKLENYYSQFGFKKFKKFQHEDYSYMDNNGMIRKHK